MVDPAVLKRKYLEETSSLNKYFICDKCNNHYKSKGALPKHFKVCELQKERTCKWCDIEFTNRGNLATHIRRVHNNVISIKDGTATKKSTALQLPCTVCDDTFHNTWQLKQHIRRIHFNLQAKTLSCDLKKINQVWFEKVLNTNVVMEIKKTGHNVLVMRKLGPNTAIKIHDIEQPITDLTSLYPIKSNNMKGVCDWCKLTFSKRCLKKHIEEKHMDVKKHYCNNCKVSFKRHYLYARHVCFKNSNRCGRRSVQVRRQTCICAVNCGGYPCCESRLTPVAMKPKRLDIRTRLLNQMPYKYNRK